MPDLTGKQLRELRARAHPLEPRVKLGKKGDTEGLRKELGDMLSKSDLVKVRLGKTTPVDLDVLAAALGAVVIQRVGRTATLYREPVE